VGTDNDEIDWNAVADATHAEWVRSEMQDEIEALRKDAERYRFIREKTVHEGDLSFDQFDAEIDACMKGEGDE
jgi:hypothetical protein